MSVWKEYPPILFLWVVNGAFSTARPVVDRAVRQVRQKPRVEELAPARRQELGVPVKVDVVGQGRRDPEDQVLGRGRQARPAPVLEVDEVLHDAPGEAGVEGGFLDETVR